MLISQNLKWRYQCLIYLHFFNGMCFYNIYEAHILDITWIRYDTTTSIRNFFKIQDTIRPGYFNIKINLNYKLKLKSKKTDAKPSPTWWPNKQNNKTRQWICLHMTINNNILKTTVFICTKNIVSYKSMSRKEHHCLIFIT
jgi:hypothetical protein